MFREPLDVPILLLLLLPLLLPIQPKQYDTPAPRAWNLEARGPDLGGHVTPVHPLATTTTTGGGAV